MDAITCQALLIRYSAALTEVNHCDEKARWDLLHMVLCPSPDFLRASLKEAGRVGPSLMAIKMSRVRATNGSLQIVDAA